MRINVRMLCSSIFSGAILVGGGVLETTEPSYLPSGRVVAEVAEGVLEPGVDLVQRQLLLGRLDDGLRSISIRLDPQFTESFVLCCIDFQRHLNNNNSNNNNNNKRTDSPGE